MYCPKCVTPLPTGKPKMKDNVAEGQVQCTGCKAIFKFTITVLHEPDLTKDQIKDRQKVDRFVDVETGKPIPYEFHGDIIKTSEK